MPNQADSVRLWYPGKNAYFGTGRLSDPVNYYGPRLGFADGLSGNPDTFAAWGWWDATALGLGNGDAVTALNDTSGNSRNLSNSGAVTYVTGIQNSLGGINIDASRYMTLGAAGPAQPYTVMWIGKRVADATGGPWADGAGTPPQGDFTTSAVTGAAGATLSATLSTFGADDTDVHLFMWEFNGASSKLYLDAETAVATGNMGTTAFAADLRFGHSSSNDIYMQEAAIWAAVLTTSQITALATYVENKYAFSIGA
jgi:hypothetical protein